MMKMRGRLALCAVAGIGLALPGLAQDMRAASEKVVACQTVVDPGERLACYETAAAELSAVLETPIAEAPTPSAPAAPTVPAAPVEQAVVASPAAPIQAPAAPAVTATAETVDAPIEQAAATTTDTREAPRSRLPSWLPRVTFGGDREVEKEPDEFETQVTRIRVNRIGRHFFTTAEGHVWRQKKPEEIRAPKRLPADVIIYQNITGGLRLKISETNRSYAVQRVE